MEYKKCYLKEYRKEVIIYKEKDEVAAIQIDGDVYTRELNLILRGYTWRATAGGRSYCFSNIQGKMYELKGRWIASAWENSKDIQHFCA